MDNKNKTSDINIHKLDFDLIEREQIPFVTLSTYVIQNIKNHFAGFIWIFLQSLPPDWKVNKIHIMNHFKISERTYQRHMSFLSSSILVCYERDRHANGTLGPVTLKVLNGLKFNKDGDPNHTAKIGIVDVNHTAKKPPSGETTPVANGTLTNTTTTTKTKKENKDNNPTPPPKMAVPPKVKKQELAVIDPNYQYPETLYQANENSEIATIPFVDNPHNLPLEIIHEWVKYRQSKKWPLSQTVWNRLNKELAKCKNPQDAFEQVVSAGWQGFTAEWITKNETKKSFFDYDKNSLADDKDIF